MQRMYSPCSESLLKEEIQMLEFWLGGILAVLLLVYLVYVLVKPEEF